MKSWIKIKNAYKMTNEIHRHRKKIFVLESVVWLITTQV